MRWQYLFPNHLAKKIKEKHPLPSQLERIGEFLYLIKYMRWQYMFPNHLAKKIKEKHPLPSQLERIGALKHFTFPFEAVR